MIRQVTKNKTTFNVRGNSEHWTSFENDTWESSTFSMLDKCLRPNDVFVDIGAWIGPISLYAASKVKKCYAFEPDPVAYSEFCANLKLNLDLEKKISLFNQAITTDGKRVKLYSRHSHGDSGSSLLKRVRSKNDFVEVDSTTFQQFVKGIDKIDFIKMDVEGAEFVILPHMLDYLKTNRPTLLISLHHAALCEYYETKFLPFGIFRRIKRFLNPSNSLIKNLANKKIYSLLKSLNFYNHYTEDFTIIDVEKLDDDTLSHLDMLLLSTQEVNTFK